MLDLIILKEKFLKLISRKLSISIIVITSSMLSSIVLLMYLLGYWVIKTEYLRVYSEEEMKTYVSSIRKTDILSQNFNKIFDVIYPEVRTNKIESSYKDYIWKHLTGVYPRRNYGKRFYSLKVSQVLNKQGEINKSKSLLNQDLVLAYGLEEFVSQSKCVDYFFNNLLIEIPIEESNTSKKLIGLNEISSHYIRKPITDLNENEIIKLISIIDCHQHKVPNNQLNGRIKLLKNIFKYRTSKSNSH